MEDLVGAALAKQLLNENPQLKISALPIVGNGNPYQQQNIPIIGPHWDLPSDGITYGKSFDLWAELKAGAIQLYLGKILSLLWCRKQFDLVIGVGDFLSGVISGIFVKKPFVFVWTMASHFDDVAKHFLKKYAAMIFCRFPKESHLSEFNVEWVGNPLLDLLTITGDDFGFDKGIKTIGVLPGSRIPAYNNLPIIMQVLTQIQKNQPVNVAFALSSKINREKFIALAKVQAGYNAKMVFSDNIGDVLNVSDLVLGLSATGNEQAAGMGKPIVDFWGGGHPSRDEAYVKQHYEYFQKGSSIVLPPNPQLVAENILSLLNNPAKMDEMAKSGIETNGGKGAIAKIANRVKEWLAKN